MKKTFLLSLVFAAACVFPPPIPPPQPPVPMPVVRLVQATIRGANNEAPAGATVVLSTDTPGMALDCPIVIAVSRAVCTLDERYPIGTGDDVYQGYLVVKAPEYETKQVRFLLTGRSQDLPDVRIELAFHELPRLMRNGKNIQTTTGQRFPVIENTDFNLLGVYSENPALARAVMHQRAVEGFNVLRVFTAYNVPLIGRFVPREHPDFCTLLQAVANDAAREGEYIEWVGFSGPYGGIFDNDNQKVEHWEGLIRCTVTSTNALLELANEYNHPANSDIPIARLRRPPAPAFASHGSATIDGPILEPLWDYATVHFADPRKVAHNAMEDVIWKYGVPATTNESQRFPDNDQKAYHAEDMARGCVLLSSGCAFHSNKGKLSQLWLDGSIELLAARAFTAGARSVPLQFQDGAYVHRADLETPAIERMYEMRLGGSSFFAPIRY